MKVVPFGQVPAQEWDAFCTESEQAWAFHRAGWIRIEAAHFFPKNHSFAVRDGEQLVGIQPLYESILGLGGWSERLLHGGIHRHTGLALGSGLSEGAAKAVRSLAMRQIQEVSQKIDCDRVQLNTQNLAPESLGPRRSEVPFWVLEYGYFLGLAMGPGGICPAPGLSTCCADQIVVLNEPEERLFGRLEESCRRAVRKGQKAGLEWEEGGSEPVDAYYRLAEISAARTGETLSARAYFEDVWREFGPTGGCRVLFVLAGGKRVAALWLLIDKGAAHYLGGVSDPEYLPLRVNDFLHWSAIAWAKRSGLSWYRLGPVFPELPDEWAVARVSRFKGKFGGKAHTTIQGSFFRYPAKYVPAAAQQVAAVAAARNPVE